MLVSRDTLLYAPSLLADLGDLTTEAAGKDIGKDIGVASKAPVKAGKE